MDAGKLAPAYQWRSLSGLGLSALPMVVHGARNGLYPSPETGIQSERCRVIRSEYEGGRYNANAGCGFGGWACVNNCEYLFSCPWLVRRGQNASREAARVAVAKP